MAPAPAPPSAPAVVATQPDPPPPEPPPAVPALRKIPLLPWPFYGRRSLTALGPEGVLALRPRSPEHRLLEQLDTRECAARGEAPPRACLFLEGRRIYAIEREPGSDPARFLMRRLDLTPQAFDAADVRLDRSDPERPLLVVRSSNS